MTKYKVGILGCGGRSRGHAPVYSEIDRADLVAICDMSEERLEAYGNDFKIQHRYTSYIEMLSKLRFPRIAEASDMGLHQRFRGMKMLEDLATGN